VEIGDRHQFEEIRQMTIRVLGSVRAVDGKTGLQQVLHEDASDIPIDSRHQDGFRLVGRGDNAVQQRLIRVVVRCRRRHGQRRMK
jgi:hypothetical protein